MDPLDIANHLLNFVAPAAALALLVGSSSGLIGPGGGARVGWLARVAVLFMAGTVVLAGGLVLWGRDGRMLTYGALVLAVATCQWLLVRGWKS